MSCATNSSLFFYSCRVCRKSCFCRTWHENILLWMIMVFRDLWGRGGRKAAGCILVTPWQVQVRGIMSICGRYMWETSCQTGRYKWDALCLKMRNLRNVNRWVYLSAGMTYGRSARLFFVPSVKILSTHHILFYCVSKRAAESDW